MSRITIHDRVSAIQTFINYCSNMYVFTNDTVVYLAIGQQQDTRTLQDDLSKLELWEPKWGMEFHPKKCQVLTFTRKHNTVKFDYKLHGHTLKRVKEAKYLGVTFQQDLRFSTHINIMTSKANRTLGFLRCNLQLESPHLKTTAYKALDRPLKEYAPTVWDPHTQKEKQQIEKVQRRSVRYVMNRHRNRSSPTEMLPDLGWLSLEERRRLHRLTMLYKIDTSWDNT